MSRNSRWPTEVRAESSIHRAQGQSVSAGRYASSRAELDDSSCSYSNPDGAPNTGRRGAEQGANAKPRLLECSSGAGSMRGGRSFTGNGCVARIDPSALCDLENLEDLIDPYPEPQSYLYAIGQSFTHLPGKNPKPNPLEGVIYYPKSPISSPPIAILTHGGTSGQNESSFYATQFNYLIRCLAANGIVAASVRSYSLSEPDDDGLTGKVQRIGYLVQNLKAVMDQMLSRGIDPSGSRVAFLGHSEGAQAALSVDWKQVPDNLIVGSVALSPTAGNYPSGFVASTSRPSLIFGGTLDSSQPPNVAIANFEQIVGNGGVSYCRFLYGGYHAGYTEDPTPNADVPTNEEISNRGLFDSPMQADVVKWYTIAFLRHVFYAEPEWLPYLRDEFALAPPAAALPSVGLYRPGPLAIMAIRDLCPSDVECITTENVDSLDYGVLADLDPRCDHHYLGYRVRSSTWVHSLEFPLISWFPPHGALEFEMGLVFGSSSPIVRTVNVIAAFEVAPNVLAEYGTQLAFVPYDNVVSIGPHNEPFGQTLLKTYRVPIALFSAAPGFDNSLVRGIRIAFSLDGDDDAGLDYLISEVRFTLT